VTAPVDLEVWRPVPCQDGTCYDFSTEDRLTEIKRVSQRDALIAKVRQFLPRQVQAWFDELIKERENG
jgi:hypothetical protein